MGRPPYYLPRKRKMFYDDEQYEFNAAFDHKLGMYDALDPMVESQMGDYDEFNGTGVYRDGLNRICLPVIQPEPPTVIDNAPF